MRGVRFSTFPNLSSLKCCFLDYTHQLTEMIHLVPVSVLETPHVWTNCFSHPQGMSEALRVTTTLSQSQVCRVFKAENGIKEPILLSSVFIKSERII